MRVGHKVIHPVGGTLVPLAQLVHLARHDGPHQRVGVAAVGIVKVPHIADGGMAVADMHGVGPGDDALAAGGRGGDDHVILRKVQRLKGFGHEGQQGAVNFGGKRNFLDIGGVDLIIPEPGGHMVLIIDQRIDGRVRENMVHTVHHPVRAGVGNQPVMDNGHPGFAVFHPRPSFGMPSYSSFSSLTIFPPNTVRNRILMSSATVQFSMYQMSYRMRSAMSVSPRRPLI